MSGESIEFSAADLAASAGAYDPARHEAPLVVGHPRHDAPAYGWVKGLSVVAGALEAETDQVAPEFAELVAAGAYKKISASFYTPEAPQNPCPGVYYLRHVGFLGAQPPAVKGLRAPAFAEAEPGVIEFSEWDDMQNASLWRRLREFLIAQFGLDKADAAVPGELVGALEASAVEEAAEDAAETAAPVMYAESVSSTHAEESSAVTPAEKAALEAENAQLKATVAAAERREKQAAAAARHAGHAAFADALVTDGRLAPAHTDFIVAFMDHVAEEDAVIEFREGEAHQAKPGIEAFKSFLGALPKVVELGEVATARSAGATAGAVSFAAPSGYTVDGDRLALHNAALVYAESNRVSYETALAVVVARRS